MGANDNSTDAATRSRHETTSESAPERPQPPEEFANVGTPYVVDLLGDLDRFGYGMIAASIVWNIQRTYVDPPSEATLYRALSQLRDVGYVTRPDGSRHVLTSAGRTYYQDLVARGTLQQLRRHSSAMLADSSTDSDDDLDTDPSTDGGEDTSDINTSVFRDNHRFVR